MSGAGEAFAAPLLRSVREVATAALASGALQPIGSRAHEVEDGGIRFSVRVASAPLGKGGEAQSSLTAARKAAVTNPD